MAKPISPAARTLGDALVKTLKETDVAGPVYTEDMRAALDYARMVVDGWDADAEEAARQYGR